MDENVIAAMARWPGVPDVFGWLSLNSAGQWRLHPDGDALQSNRSEDQVSMSQQVSQTNCLPCGEPITSPQINRFINQNYDQDDQGRWFFQNGPQRVYVRLDAAPYVLHTVDNDDKAPAFLTHNGISTCQVTQWCLDDAGRLYAVTERGPGLIAGRDLEHVLHHLSDACGTPLLDVLARGADNVDSVPAHVRWNKGGLQCFHQCRACQVPDVLGFVRRPAPTE